ncbi:hypothetical protein BH09MYX1_BH09MYX1_07550 [soil metagenome]
MNPARPAFRASFRWLSTLSLLFGVGLISSEAYAQKITFGGGGAPAPTATGTATVAKPPPATTTTPAGKPAAAAPADATPTETPPSDEWKDRDRTIDEASSLHGDVGILHVEHAQIGNSGQFRLGFTSEFYAGGFLCTPEFPCPNPRGGAKITSDSLSHIGGTISLDVSILKWLEAYATTGAYANSDDQNRPTLLQVLGDINFGVKAGGGITKWLYVAGLAELHLVNCTGAVGLAGGATGGRLAALATTDFRGLDKSLPLRFSANFGYQFDNSGAVVEDTEARRGQPVTRIERFGLNINRVDQFNIAVGGEAFILDDRIRPFLEYRAAIPVNRQGYLCRPNNPSGDQCLANNAVVPSAFTIGARFFPWKHGFSLLAAFDIGVTGVANFIEEVQPQLPWTLFLGGSWAVDTWERPPVEKIVTKENRVEIKPVPRGHLKGLVHEKDKNDGIPGAIVVWENHPELTALYTGPDGRFNTQELADGNYAFTIKADGFKDGTCAGALAKAADVQVDCALEALPRVGILVGHVRDGETMGPVPNAIVKLKDATGKDYQVTADSQGGYRFENVAPGTSTLSVDANEYLSFVAPADVKVRQEITSDAMIRHRPKTALVTVGATEITIKQQVQYALDQAIILPESIPLLTEIADVLIHNPRIKRVEIQGHTDNSGTVDHNQTLSEQRAESVRSWLTSHGVTPDRLVSKGYGQSKPLVPNVTTANKAKNRRVQFIILEQDPAAGTKPATGGGVPAGGAKPPF